MTAEGGRGLHPIGLTCLAVFALLAVNLMGCGSSSAHHSHPKDVKLSNGVSMPLVAAGTWQYNDSVAEKEVVAAIKSGFKHIDTAHDYGNQVGVGKGLLASGVERGDVFVTSKVPGCGIQGLGKEDCYNNTFNAIKEDITLLGSAGFNIGHLDLLLIHFPPCMTATGTEPKPSDTVCGKQKTGCSDAANCKAIGEQWRAVELAYEQKLVKAVGVSNYCSACFDCLSNTTVKPMVNQVQMHVGMGPDPQGIVSLTHKKNMILQAWSPLGSGGHGNPDILSGNLTTGIANAHSKSTAQVALRWLLQHGASIATKSNNPEHLAEDLALFDWELTDEEMKSLDSADFAKSDTPSFLCDNAQPNVPEVAMFA